MEKKDKRYAMIMGLLILLLIPACDLLVSEGDCKASDGGHDGQIEVEWGGLDYVSGEPALMYYEIQRSRNDIFFFEPLTETTNTTYTDTAVLPGVLYYYRVRAFYSDYTWSNYTTADSGFTMDGEILSIGSYEKQYPLEGTAGPEYYQWQWYKILAQKGWSYTVETYSDTTPADTWLYLYYEDSLTPLADDDDGESIPDSGISPYSRINYTFDRSGIYFIKVYAFDPDSSFMISMWHHP